MLEIVDIEFFEELVFEFFLSVFFTGINGQVFMLVASSVTAMDPQSGRLVDACVVQFIEFHVDCTFPGFASLIVVSGPFGV